MSDKKKQYLTSHVHAIDPSGALVSLKPGDVAPDWVTNKKILTDVDFAHAPDEATGAETVATEPALGDLKVGELKKLAKTLGLSQGGNKDVLIARIAEKQAADAASATGEHVAAIATESVAAATADASDDAAGREALEARVLALGLAVESEATDAELEALIASAE